MPAFRSFNLPDLGEGLTEGEILQWLVSEGDTITLNQPIVEVETAKAAVEIPSPYAGIVTTLHFGAGETVDVGLPIITVDTDPNGVDEDRPSIQGGDLVPSEPVAEEKITVLVGSGPKNGALTRRARKPQVAPEPPVVHQIEEVQPARVSAAAVGAHAAQVAGEVHVLAKPPVRKLARDLGVDLRALTGSGPNGVVTRDDVTSAANGHAIAPRSGASHAVVSAGERIPIKGVRKATAAAMVASAFTAPHVTEWATTDITATMDLVASLKNQPEMAGLKVTPLLIVAKALLVACRRYPMVNASWDEPAGEIVVHGSVNLGIAAATPRGLIVPNIKGADQLSLAGLAAALGELVAVAREGKTTPADMQHGTITITNVGVFGVDTGTPILNPGEAAILCFGAVRDTPWVHEGEIAIRKVTQLALSFDHRLVDGQLGSEVLADVARSLNDPMRLLL